MSTEILRVRAGGSLQGDIRVPGDKSISHRAIMLGSIARGTTEVRGFLEGEDTRATMQAFCDMGVEMEHPAPGRLSIKGAGLDGLEAPSMPLDLGNSGTSMRLLSGLLAGQRFDSQLVGDASLSSRPMERILKPLSSMGARIESLPDGRPPLKIGGGASLIGIDYEMPMASAQVKSCLLLAGLYASGSTSVLEPAPARDHTECMLAAFGYPLQRERRWVCLRGGGELRGISIQIPADISSAAFFMVGAAIAPGSDILLEQVGVNPTRTGVIDILRLMGADISLDNVSEAGGEAVADIRVKSSCLHGITIPESLVPLAIDEFPALFIAAACATGETVLTGAAELRVKESDRIEAMADALSALGITVETTVDGIRIQGGSPGGGVVNSRGDHRVAMALAMAGLRAKEEILITDCANISTSFPGFMEIAAGAGLNFGAGIEG